MDNFFLVENHPYKHVTIKTCLSKKAPPGLPGDWKRGFPRSAGITKFLHPERLCWSPDGISDLMIENQTSERREK